MASIKTQPRTKQRGRARMNKAQEQAMRVRASQTVPRQLHRDRPSAEAATLVAETDAATAAAPAPSRSERVIRKASAAKSRVVAHPFVLSKQQEYAFIRADLIRLLTTMAILFVLMLVLLYIVEG